MKGLQWRTSGAIRLGSDDELAQAIGILMQHFKQLMRPKVRSSGLRRSVTYRRVSSPWLKDRSLFFHSHLGSFLAFPPPSFIFCINQIQRTWTEGMVPLDLPQMFPLILLLSAIIVMGAKDEESLLIHATMHYNEHCSFAETLFFCFCAHFSSNNPFSLFPCFSPPTLCLISSSFFIFSDAEIIPSTC